MQYREPLPPEDINVTPVHPLRELVVLLGGALAVVLAVSLLLAFAGGWLARQLPYEQELRIAPQAAFEPAQVPDALQAYVQGIADRLAPSLALPAGMQVRISIAPVTDANAFATLGGHIVLFRGLLRKLPNENALAMLLAHEMAHLALRHPIEALGERAALRLGLALLGASDIGVLNAAGVLVATGYSRSMEAAADAMARDAVLHGYGHLAGADALFEVLLEESEKRGRGWQPPFFDTHPATELRLQQVRNAAAAKGVVTPLPGEFPAWLDAISRAGPQPGS